MKGREVGEQTAGGKMGGAGYIERRWMQGYGGRLRPEGKIER